ncbi:mannosyltransferase family protein [Streptomyces sp. NPDC053493]|uniref:mannosyltransferase family protein n=1 Tax=Streptomyces sp. NPDC053493 TaxID=3365705 RepID=UPI0037D76893
MSPVLIPRPSVPARRGPAAAPRLGLLRRAAPALLGYLAVRLLGLAVLAHWAHGRGRGLWPLLATSWDSGWYLQIADRGYDHELGGPGHHDNLAFFPLFPALIKAFAAVTPGSRASVALVLAGVCSLLAALGVFAVGDRLHGRRTGTVLAVLWGAAPAAAVQWMGYTESLFTALAAWALYAVLNRRWAWAAALAVGAGLTRPTGVAVAAAVSVAALQAARTGGRGGRAAALAAAVAAPTGWLGYVAWVGLRLDRWDGYLAVQRTWTNQWDGGLTTLRMLRGLLVLSARPPLFLVAVSAVLVLSAALYVLCVAGRQPLPLLVFGGVLLVVVLGSAGVYFPRARFLMPGFPLLLPVALAVSRARPAAAAVVLGLAALTSAWLGGHMLLVWPGPP